MTQNVLDYSQNPSGAELMDTFLAGMAENQLTNHSGTSRPSYAQAGTFWIDTTTNPWVLKQFTGTNDIVIGTLDQTGLAFVARRALQDANGNVITSTYLTTSGTAARATADANGNVITSTYLTTNGTAARATADASGNNIANTYATKTELDQKSSFKLFHHDWFDYQLNDMDWLRADTFSWQSGTVYSNAYNHLVNDYNTATAQWATETIGSYTIWYLEANDGHKIIFPESETTATNIYNATGVAWYYILDTTNQRFKLPRELPITDRAKGNGMTLGLTDGTNLAGLNAAAPTGSYPGALGGSLNMYGKNVGDNTGTVPILSSSSVGITTDPTKSGIIVNRDNTDSQKYLYFYVGQFSQSATEQTAGLNSELFNGKADIEALDNKIQLVSTAPASQTNGVLYVIPE